MQQSVHRKTIATTFSRGNNTKPLLNWTKHHRSVHRTQPKHRPLLQPTEFHVFSPHSYRISGTNTIRYYLQKKTNLNHLNQMTTQKQTLTNTTGNVYHWTLFAQTKSGRHGQHQTNRFNEQRPFAQVATNNESGQNGLNLRYTGTACIRCKHFHQRSAEGGKEQSPQCVE